jgi:hypothetical protein
VIHYYAIPHHLMSYIESPYITDPVVERMCRWTGALRLKFGPQLLFYFYYYFYLFLYAYLFIDDWCIATVGNPPPPT